MQRRFLVFEAGGGIKIKYPQGLPDNIMPITGGELMRHLRVHKQKSLENGAAKDQPAAGKRLRSRLSRMFRPTENESLVKRRNREYTSKVDKKEWSVDEDGSLLHFAARHGHLALLEENLAVPSAADTINTESLNGRTSLELAVEQGHAKAIKRLFQSDATIGAYTLLLSLLRSDRSPRCQELAIWEVTSGTSRFVQSGMPNIIRRLSTVSQAPPCGDTPELASAIDRTQKSQASSCQIGIR
jgi:hypothetical protein